MPLCQSHSSYTVSANPNESFIHSQQIIHGIKSFLYIPMRMFLASFIHVISYTLMYAKLCSIHSLYYLDNKFNYFIAFALIVSFAVACVSLCSCYNAFFQIYMRKVGVVGVLYEWEMELFGALNQRFENIWDVKMAHYAVPCIMHIRLGC